MIRDHIGLLTLPGHATALAARGMPTMMRLGELILLWIDQKARATDATGKLENWLKKRYLN